MEEFLLNRHLARNELDVVNQKRVALAETVAELVHRLVRQTRNHLIREVLPFRVGDLHVGVVLLHPVDDCAHQVRFSKPAVTVNEQRIVVRCGMVRNRNAGGVRKFVGAAHNEVVERVFKTVNRHDLVVLIAIRPVVLPTVGLCRGLHVDSGRYPLGQIGFCRNRPNRVRRRGRSRKDQLHADVKPQQTAELGLNLVQILFLDNGIFEFGRNAHGDEIPREGENVDLSEPKVDRRVGKRLAEGLLHQIPDLPDFLYVFMLRHAEKNPFPKKREPPPRYARARDNI